MILTLQELITPDELALIRQKIATVAFTDGSMLRVMCGMFSARAARRLVAALPPR